MDARVRLAARYAALHPTEAARALDGLAPAEAAALLVRVEPEVAAGVLDLMLPQTAVGALSVMDPDEQSALLSLIPSARCVPILRAAEGGRRALLLSRLPHETADEVQRLLSAPERSAGVLAEPARSVLSPRTTSGEARRLMRDLAEPYAYVVDEERRLVGVVHRRDILASEEGVPVESLMSRGVVRLPAAAPSWAARNHPAWREFDVLPVVDRNEALIGLLRHRSLRRLDAERASSSGERRPALGALLALGELYWGGLSTFISGMAGGGSRRRVRDGS